MSDDTTTASIEAAVAERLIEAHATGTTIGPIRDDLADGGIDAAYRVQQLVVDRWLAEGQRIVGRKIGLTAEAVQRQLGVDQPDFGALTANMCLISGDPIPHGAVLQPRVEAEVALVIDRDLDQPDLTGPELMRAVDHVLPAIEVVGSRITDWDISILDTVADNASAGMFVLGTRPVRPGDIELADVEMTTEINGVTVATGIGSACLGHPYRAALWLARRLATENTPLRAGDAIMTGALGPMAPLAPGAEVVATISGLGRVLTAGASA